jgi:hypothetical protein
VNRQNEGLKAFEEKVSVVDFIVYP